MQTIHSAFDEQRREVDMNAAEEVLCPPGAPLASLPVGADADTALAVLAKAVGHPIRARIVRLLAGQGTCMYGFLADQLPLAKSTVSQHLKILREAGLVRGEVDGPRVCYCIDPAGLDRLKLLVAAL
jgi:ArsR family transcriptional regulator